MKNHYSKSKEVNPGHSFFQGWHKSRENISKFCGDNNNNNNNIAMAIIVANIFTISFAQ